MPEPPKQKKNSVRLCADSSGWCANPLYIILCTSSGEVSEVCKIETYINVHTCKTIDTFIIFYYNHHNHPASSVPLSVYLTARDDRLEGRITSSTSLTVDRVVHAALKLKFKQPSHSAVLTSSTPPSQQSHPLQRRGRKRTPLI